MFALNAIMTSHITIIHTHALASCILHLASHLGTLYAPREGCDDGAEPEDGVWWTYPEDGRTPGVYASIGDTRQLSVI